MILLYLGNVGSGKTLSAVVDMVENRQHLEFYTNVKPLKPKETPWIIPIKPEMIVKKELLGMKKHKGGKEEPVYKYELNKEFWLGMQGKAKSIVLDEIHNMMNARRPGSKVNVIMGDFLALARRIVGDDPQAEGDMILITQLGRRADIIAREMAHKIVYHVGHYTKTCQRCGCSWRETSEMPEQAKVCLACGFWRLKKHSHFIEKWHFAGTSAFDAWRSFGLKTFHKHYFLRNVERYFPYYSTLQWENLLSDLY